MIILTKFPLLVQLFCFGRLHYKTIKKLTVQLSLSNNHIYVRFHYFSSCSNSTSLYISHFTFQVTRSTPSEIPSPLFLLLALVDGVDETSWRMTLTEVSPGPASSAANFLWETSPRSNALTNAVRSRLPFAGYSCRISRRTSKLDITAWSSGPLGPLTTARWIPREGPSVSPHEWGRFWLRGFWLTLV